MVRMLVIVGLVLLPAQLPAQDVVDTSGLLYEYRTIVDKAMVDMQVLFDAAKPKLDTLSTGTGQRPGGKPADAGPPAQRGRP